MDFRMVKSVRTIIKLGKGAAGTIEPVEIYRRPEPERKKGTRQLRPLDRTMRDLARAQQVAADTYLQRHDQSNEKKRDGWLRDMGNNVYRASCKGRKALKIQRLLFP